VVSRIIVILSPNFTLLLDLHHLHNTLLFLQILKMPDQIKYNNKLQGSRVLLIGGTSGIGFGVAEAVVEQGASKVIVVSSRKVRVDSAIERLKQAYPSSNADITGYVCDLSKESTVDSTIKDLFERTGELDHIVYSAGDTPPLYDFDTVTLGIIQQAGWVRFYGPLLVAIHGRKKLVQSPKSTITITTGATSEKPWKGSIVASSWLAGLHGMVRSLALEIAPIRVNLISPGGIET
jgi:NAD(P)-dependent dehydrogenase (short-subunit alcohol dehydrogenase family)